MHRAGVPKDLTPVCSCGVTASGGIQWQLIEYHLARDLKEKMHHSVDGGLFTQLIENTQYELQGRPRVYRGLHPPLFRP